MITHLDLTSSPLDETKNSSSCYPDFLPYQDRYHVEVFPWQNNMYLHATNASMCQDVNMLPQISAKSSNSLFPPQVILRESSSIIYLLGRRFLSFLPSVFFWLQSKAFERNPTSSLSKLTRENHFNEVSLALRSLCLQLGAIITRTAWCGPCLQEDVLMMSHDRLDNPL